MANLITILKWLFLSPLAILFSVIGTVLFLVIFLLQFIPLGLYRFFVFVLAKCVYPDAKMLTGNDNFIAGGSVYKTRELYNALNVIVEGKVDLDRYILEATDKILMKRLPNGKLQNPELQCYVQNFMGYSFYRKDKNFDIKNHIKVYESSHNGPINKTQFQKIRKECSLKLFQEKRSPWEVFIIHNYRKDEEDGKEYTSINLKVHHCLSDGYATINAILQTFGEIPDLRVPKFGNNCMSRSLVSISSFFHLFKMIGGVLFNLIYSPRKAFDLNSWQKLIKKQDTDAVLWSPEPISTEIVKEIARANKVSVSSVLINACAGAFRRMMEAKGIKSPKNIRVGFTHHMPNPSGRLTNNSSGTFFTIPVSNHSPSVRLKKTNKNMIIALAASFKFLTYLFFGLTKYLPSAFKFGNSIRKSFVTMGITTVPMPSFDVEWAGCKMVEVYNNIEFVDNCVALIVTVLKYKNQFCVTFMVQRTLLKNDEEICEIEKHFLEELNFLKTNCDNV